MLTQMLLPLLLLCDSGLALGGRRKIQRKFQTRLRMEPNAADISKREDSCVTDCPLDCKDLFDKGHHDDGVYTIFINTKDIVKPVDVYCDMAGGGWTVFQRRSNGLVDFYRDWVEYEQGFGNLKSEHWLGLRYLNLILAQKKYRLRVDLEDFDGETAYAQYSNFAIDSPQNKYTLRLGSFEGGEAGDSMDQHTNMKFSTRDQDNDLSGYECAVDYHGGWWYKYDVTANLNGLYTTAPKSNNRTIMIWYTWGGWSNPQKSTAMKFRPM